MSILDEKQVRRESPMTGELRYEFEVMLKNKGTPPIDWKKIWADARVMQTKRSKNTKRLIEESIISERWAKYIRQFEGHDYKDYS